ncbi:Profilin/allergen [Coprinopsis marcescibilis]|uniref:Profilin n=1 Tax=Coprinopsis marcescibilis TaxID=230819 RepID=A0A5C3KJ36_COPMA|nr:Profilin/allergen [Coprinopsis marcescibilis]
MSWQAYVDTNLVGTGKVARAAILGQQGGVWATSSNLTLSPEEQAAIVSAAKNAFNGAADQVQANGLRLAGVKYFTLRLTDRSIYLKQGANGAIIAKTKQAILVAIYEEPIQAAEATPIVESLADYLISVSY